MDHPGADRTYMIPFLFMTLSDRYPMLRWFARKSLLALGEHRDDDLLNGLEAWDYIASDSEREAFVQLLWSRWAALDKGGISVPAGLPLDENLMPVSEQVEMLTAQRRNKEIEIGE